MKATTSESARGCVKVAHAVLLTAITVYVPWAQAHMAPIKNDASSYRRRDYVGDWHRETKDWNRDWNRRWYRNWDNSWSNWDNDYPVDTRKYRYVSDTQTINTASNTQTSATAPWSSLPQPGNDIPNFSEVHPWLFRGGQPTMPGMEQLYHMGVRTVIDLRSDPQQIKSEQYLCNELGMKLVSIPISKTAGPSTASINKFLSTVDFARQHPDAGAVYVHCHHGGNRTGAMVGIYRMARDNYSYDDARWEMQRFGFDPKLTKLAAPVKAEAGRQHAR